ncbi:serine/threonine protein kinase [Merismopedia glauca]|uniref:Serine/threonine protein kinase n=1 Tax=Merismopedia glauca CCAP 1448/3 TaxID=1296344 RepID=A0A2T1BZP6_9CYAN|nr:serine/threonine-protein kinase [Merismopedia glauca]PSB01496.1 serine/threonine protein kinase [Merismopedia glauca CCAP 1448/3]
MIGEILGDRYQVTELLAKNAGRKTLLAKDIQTEQLVVVKLLTFSAEFEWENLKLFEREAQTLKFISHPAIPNYLDFFDWDSPKGKHLALVQSYVDGKSLEAQLKSGRHFTEAELKDIAYKILQILVYLHGLQPPIIHRDIKPSNIILTNRSGNSVGEVYLVDFGSVQTVAAKTQGTITIVGTYGYMPPEQFGGRVVPASDLYSLGATLIFLSTGIHPADLPQAEGRIEFQKITNLGVGFTNWLRRMTQPSLDQRFVGANTALKALEELPKKDLAVVPEAKPSNTKIILTKTANKFEFMIPPSGFNPGMIAIGAFALAWNSFLVFFNGFSLFAPFPINLVFALFSLPFWGVGLAMIMAILFPLFGQTTLKITPDKIGLTFKMWGIQYNPTKVSPRDEIDKISYVPKHSKKDSDGDRVQVPAKLIVWAGIKKYELSACDSISEREIDWLAQELSDWLGLPLSKEVE